MEDIDTQPARYLSVCSGIEAASVAWHPLGWQPLAFSEIEPFPRAVLAHHYPDVPIHGDFTKLRDMDFIVDADVLVGGTPCQAFSVAGLRNSLADDRGNLSLEYVRLADAIDDFRLAAGRQPAVILWENVPGVLSVKDNAFGCFLAALAGDVAPYVPPRGKWTDAGVVAGPQRTVAWRILDAQYFGLAQRRRRVFVVASAREGFDPAAVLLELEGVRRDTAPRREAGQGTAAIPSRSTAGGGLGTDFDCDGGVITLAHGQGGAEVARERSPTLTCIHEAPIAVIPVAHTLKGEGFDASEDGTGRGTPLVPVAYRTAGNDGVYETGDIVHALTTATDPNGHVLGCSYKDSGNDATADLSPTLRALGAYDANGGGQMAVAYSIMPQNSGKDYKAREVEVAQPIMAGGPVSGNQGGDVILQTIPFDTTQITSPFNYSKPKDGDPCHPLAAGAHPPSVAYAFQPRIARNGRGDMGEVVNALQAQSGETGKGDAAPCVAYNVTANRGTERRGAFETPVHASLRARTPGQSEGSTTTVVHQHMAVRRLTPVECERLQGFPDNYTLIPWRKKPAADCPDGPRYKALGNSMAVPCMRWIGARINQQLAANADNA